MDTQITNNPTNCSECGKPYKMLEVPFVRKVIRLPFCNCIGANWEKEQRERKIADYLDASNIPEKFRNENFSDWVDIKGTENLKDSVERYILCLNKNIKKGRGMFISGMKGTGKTKAQCYIGNVIIRKLVKRVYYISITKFLADIDETKKARGNIESYIDKYVNVPVLILDDVGESNVEDWNRRYLFLLLDGRNNRRCVTLANTMRHVKDNNKYIGEHNLSRILEMVGRNIVEIKSQTDMRYFGNKEKAILENGE